jgi:hypothetical protein
MKREKEARMNACVMIVEQQKDWAQLLLWKNSARMSNWYIAWSENGATRVPSGCETDYHTWNMDTPTCLQVVNRDRGGGERQDIWCDCLLLVGGKD